VPGGDLARADEQHVAGLDGDPPQADGGIEVVRGDGVARLEQFQSLARATSSRMPRVIRVGICWMPSRDAPSSVIDDAGNPL